MDAPLEEDSIDALIGLNDSLQKAYEKSQASLIQSNKDHSAFVKLYTKHKKEMKRFKTLYKDSPVVEDGENLEKEAENILPQSGNEFYCAFLGHGDIRLYSSSKRTEFKDEYEKYKVKFNFVYLVVSTLFWLNKMPRWTDCLFQLTILYFYLTVALREAVLKANGSRIKKWWSRHHFLSMLLSLVVIIWPESESYTEFRSTLFVFGIYNGALGLWQARFQLARLYKMKALGHAGSIDTSMGDVTALSEKLSPEMLILLPFILFGQGFQFYNSIELAKLVKSESDWQVFLASILFFLLGLGNLVTTSQVYWSKATKKVTALKRVHSSAAELQKKIK